MMKKHRKIKARIPYLIIILCVVLCSCNRSDVAETDTEIDQVVENEKSTAESKSDDAENHSIVWVTDNNLHWSETKSAKIKQVLNDNGWSEPEEVTVISLKDDLLLEKLQEMKDDKQEVTYISVHDKKIAQQIVENGYGFEIYDMSDKEKYPFSMLDVEASDLVRESLGDYVILSALSSSIFSLQTDYVLAIYSLEDMESIFTR
ncbi:MAG: hypothetical protein MR966_02430 [Lachnospiraceae bacterium]|nr:hypothetical protein [Lachnospiraceae bacterium]